MFPFLGHPSLLVTAPPNITKISFQGIPGEQEGITIYKQRKASQFPPIFMVCLDQLWPYFVGTQHETTCFVFQGVFFSLQ